MFLFYNVNFLKMLCFGIAVIFITVEPRSTVFQGDGETKR